MTEQSASPGNADAFLIVKRGLFYRPKGQGYTGIRDEAGRYSEESARFHAKRSECTIIRADEAPEFMPAAHNDLVIKHLIKQRDHWKAAADNFGLTLDDLGENDEDPHPDCPCKPGKCIYPECTCALTSTSRIIPTSADREYEPDMNPIDDAEFGMKP